MRKNYLLLWSLGLLLFAVCTQAHAGKGNPDVKKPDRVRKEKPVRMNPAKVRKNGVMPVHRTARNPLAKAYQPKKMYGYLVYDDTLYDLSLCHFNLNDLSTIHVIDMGVEYYPDLACGAYGNGLYYYYGCDDGGYANFFASVDLETNERTILNDYELQDYFIVYDMTFDYSTNTFYAIVSTDDGDTLALVTVNAATGSLETVADLDDYYVALAATYEGRLYAITLSGDLYAIDKTDGTAEWVLETGFSSDYLCNQSMDFDHTDGSLYWNSYLYHDDGEYYESALVRINLKEETVENLGVVGDNAQLCGLYIPFVRNSLDAPSVATEVMLVPDADGGNSAVLSWKNPETTLNEDPLAGLTKVEIYRNDALVKTFDRPEAGAMASFEDKEVPTGLYTYKIVAFNTAGDGVPVTATAFVGHDVPAAVSLLTLVKEGDRTAKLSWEAPTAGMNGGWIDTSSLVYRITRYPDGREVTSDFPDTEYLDGSLTSLNNYFYTVEASTADGKGGVAESGKVLIGTALSLPYQASLNREEALQWTIVDVNGDGKSWDFDTLLAEFFFRDDRPGAYYFGAEEGADEWLISSPVALEGSKSYRVSLDAQVSTKGEVAVFEITLGKGTDVAAHRVVTTFRVTDNFNPEEKVVSVVGPQDGDYRIGVHLKTTDRSKLRIVRFEVDRCVASYLSGAVTSEQQPLDNVLVRVKGQDGRVAANARTDAKGAYALPYIEQGTWLLSATLPGYEPLEQELIVGEPEIRTVNLELVKADEIALGGVVKNEMELPLAAVSVVLRGDLTYQAATKEDGTFGIPRVAAGTYTLVVYKNGYEQYTAELDLTADKILNAIVLKHKVLPPSEVNAGIDYARLTVNWKEPVDFRTFRYDNGKQIRDFGLNGGTYYGIAGSVYRQPAKLTAASWYTIEDGYDDHDYVNLFIFDLDASGEPTNRLLFKVDGIKNENGSWTTYAFEEPVDCPNGFVVALSVDGGYLALGATDADEDYPFVPQTQCSSRDYETEAFYYLEELDYRNNFMIRAEGIPTGAPLSHLSRMIGPDGQPVKTHVEGNGLYSRQIEPYPVVTSCQTAVSIPVYPAYNVYRLKEGEEEQTGKWTLLTPQPLAAFAFADESWNTLPQGYYKYAVQAVYTGNRLSGMALSEEVGKEVWTQVDVRVTTNVDGASVEGATVRLAGDRDTYTESADASGKVAFSHILKGKYRLSAGLRGCGEFTQDVDYSTDAAYTADVRLSEELAQPRALRIARTDGERTYRLSWNEFTIKDDFENHPDFAINSPGTVGWSYIDGDGSVTKGFKDGSTGEWYEFENMFAPMAFIVFNPSAVEPSMESDFKAHSGRKFLACMGGETANDDYLISPELGGSDSFEFSFFALSYDGKDRMEAGYSFGGTDTGDFVWSSGVVEVNAAKEWKEYSYEIPAGVRRVAVRCVSADPVIFMIDDVCLTTQPASSAASEGLGAHEYEIYLDGKKVAAQRTISYDFAGVPEGKHTAGVKSVYRSGASGVSTVDFEVTSARIEDETAEEVLLYPNPVKEHLYVNGEVERIEIYGLNGVLLGNYDHPVRISLGHLDDGVYTARIVTQDGTRVKKIVIRK